jgi:hypothetical protein
VAEARQSPTILADGLLEWFPPPDEKSLDAKASARVVAEALIRIIGALTVNANRRHNGR